MRFLHTGDWHVGKTLRGRSRLEEHAAALDVVIDAAVDARVDAVLVAGDIHDRRSVSPDADALIFDAFLRLADAGIPVVAVAGNHDSAPRLDALSPLLERIGTRAVARVRRPRDGGVVEIAARSGAQRAIVACVPFVSPRRFSDAAAIFDDLATGYVDFDAGMGLVLGAYERCFEPNAVNVVLGHLFVAGAKPAGSEREITIGAEYAVAAQHLPATATYVALGHIHRPQKVPGAPCDARYSGSLLQLDFGETGQRKSVWVVDAQPGKPPKVEDIAVTAGRPLVDVDTTLADLARVAEGAGDAYLRVSVHIDRPETGIADRVRDALPNALDVRLVLPLADGEPGRPSLRGLEPRAQFVAYFEARRGSPPPDDVLDAFDRVHEEVTA